MKTYGDLDLKKLREECGLDFAHFTYQRGQCSCCYGPKDLPDKYWAKGKKPKVIKTLYREDGSIAAIYWNRRDEDIQYILFKNANNGLGIVTKEDIICKKPKNSKWHDSVFNAMRVYIEWQFPEEKMDQVLTALYNQLDSDYAIIRPESSMQCIEIAFTQDLTEADRPHVFKPAEVA